MCVCMYVCVHAFLRVPGINSLLYAKHRLYITLSHCSQPVTDGDRHMDSVWKGTVWALSGFQRDLSRHTYSVWGLYPAVSKAYSWLCTWGITPGGVRDQTWLQAPRQTQSCQPTHTSFCLSEAVGSWVTVAPQMSGCLCLSFPPPSTFLLGAVGDSSAGLVP